MRSFEELMKFAKEYGFFYPSSSIYGGKAGFYDYGSLGTLLKRKWENLWRKYFLSMHPNFWEIEPSQIMPEQVFQASGHLENFNDPVVECLKCKQRFRADKLIEEKLGIDAEGKSLEELTQIIRENGLRCPVCGGELSEVKWFNLMFPVFVGPEIGGFFAEMNRISEKTLEARRAGEIIEKIRDKKRLITKDGIDLMTFVKEKMKNPDELFLYLDEDYNTYIVNRKTGEGVYIDMFTQEAVIYSNDAEEVIKANREKYEDIDVEKEFEEFLSKIKDEVYVENVDINALVDYYEDMKKNRMFLRPETAQGVYVNFKLEYLINREKLPLGLAIIGKAFRNEISPRQGLIRLREFTQAELQIFFDPEEFEKEFDKHFSYEEIKDKELILLPIRYRGKHEKIKKTVDEWRKELGLPEWYLYFLYKVQQFYLEILKIPEKRFRLKELSEEEKAFYNKFHFDVEIYFDSLKGWKEVGGIHYRTDHDLSGHQRVSGEKLSIKKDGREFIPHVLELSFGVDRNVLALLDIFLEEDEKRIVFRIPPVLSPIEVAVFPLVSNRPEIVKKAKEVYAIVSQRFKAFYDESGSIGKRYRRQDLRGTPFCITIDYQTLEDDTVTVRDRDTMEQERVKISELNDYLSKKFSN